MKKALLFAWLAVSCAAFAQVGDGNVGVPGGAQYSPGFFPRSIFAGPFAQVYDDFLTTNGITVQTFGSPTTAGTCGTSTTYLDNTSPGNLSLVSGINTSAAGAGADCVGAGGAFYLFDAATSPPWTWETRVIVPVLPATTASSYQAGMSHTWAASPWTTGIGFYLSSANGVVNDWYCRYSSTQTDTGVPAVVSTWTRLSLYDDGVNVHWFINGVEATACKTPIASMPTNALSASWTSAAGTTSTSVTMGIDYYLVQMQPVR